MHSFSKFIFGLKLPLVLILLLVFLCGCSTEDKGKLVFVKADEVIRMMADKETFVFYIGSTKCSYCVKYKPEMEAVVKKKEVTIYGVLLDESEIESAELLISQMDLKGTPTTYAVVGGEVSNQFSGYVKSKEVISWLKTNEFIK